MSTTLPKPHLLQELHCLDHDPCRCTQRACQRPCRVTAAVVHHKGHVSVHVRELHCPDHQKQLSCTTKGTSASTSENCTFRTTNSSCRAQQRARQHPHPRTHCLDHQKQLSCTTTGRSTMLSASPTRTKTAETPQFSALSRPGTQQSHDSADELNLRYLYCRKDNVAA